MEIQEILTIAENVEKDITNVKEIITDYNTCSNQTSKQCLMAILTKLIQKYTNK